MRSTWSNIGVLRLFLLAFTLCLLPLAFLSDAEPVGAGFLWAYVVPSLVIILLFVLLFDALMNRVFMVDETDAQRRVLRRRLRADLLVIGLLLLFWGPYFYQLASDYAKA